MRYTVPIKMDTCILVILGTSLKSGQKKEPKTLKSGQLKLWDRYAKMYLVK